MSSRVTLVTLTNTEDGYRATAAIDGTPSGSLEFWASRTPDSDDATLIPSNLSGDGVTYYLEFGHAALWYVWAKDSDGFSVEHEAVLIGRSDAALLDALGDWLRDTLWANRKGIEVYMRSIYPDITLKQVVHGKESDLTDWPSILISDGTARPEYVFMPFGTQTNVQFAIQCPVVHEDEKTERRLAARLGEAVWKILRQPAYHDVELTNGVIVNFGMITEVVVSEFMAGDRTCASATLFWTGQMVGQDTGD